jgi:hypothetical protein
MKKERGNTKKTTTTSGKKTQRISLITNHSSNLSVSPNDLRTVLNAHSQIDVVVIIRRGEVTHWHKELEHEITKVTCHHGRCQKIRA